MIGGELTGGKIDEKTSMADIFIILHPPSSRDSSG